MINSFTKDDKRVRITKTSKLEKTTYVLRFLSFLCCLFTLRAFLGPDDFNTQPYPYTSDNDTGVTRPIKNGYAAAIFPNPCGATLLVNNAMAPLLQNSYPPKCKAIARLIKRQDVDLGLRRGFFCGLEDCSGSIVSSPLLSWWSVDGDVEDDIEDEE